MATDLIIQYQPYGGFPQWYTSDGFTDLLNAMTVNEKADLIKAEVDEPEKTLFCEDCGGNIKMYENAVYLDGKVYCEDCFKTIFADMPLKDLVKRAGFESIEAIDG